MVIAQLVEGVEMKKSSISIVCLGALLFLYGTAHATILHVPGDYPTIQAALVYAGTGDTIMVAPGTYYEHIIWPSTQGIYLVSEYGADSTIIDALGSLRAITIETNIDSTTVIKGFTIVNGNEDYGGGIHCVLASPTISNNTIMNNYATFGGGIFCNESAPIIIQNLITDNVASADGGGISCWYFSSPKIVDNIIENNSAFYTSGGGIYSVDSWPEITGNTVNSNSADLGGGMYFYKSTPIITHNIVSNNNAQYGDGLCFYESDGDVNHNDIFGNGCGIYKPDPGLINAEYNWWGDASGPYHPTLNPGGLGDKVSDNIDFDPWLYNPWGVAETPIVNPVGQRNIISATIFRGPLQLPEGMKCRVFDITGRVVASDKMQPGIYFIEIDGVVTQKVVKVR